MLVRVSYTEDAVPPDFDETQNRTTRHLENEGWVEYIVAWRKDRLELYADHVCRPTSDLFVEYHNRPMSVAYPWERMVNGP